MPAPLCLRELVQVRHSSSSGFGTKQRKETKNNIEIATNYPKGAMLEKKGCPSLRLLFSSSPGEATEGQKGRVWLLYMPHKGYAIISWPTKYG